MKKDWKIVKIPEVLFFQEGPGVRKHQFTNEGVKLLNVGNINDGQINLNKTKIFISEKEAYSKYKHFLIDDGDLVIASSGIVVSNFHNKIAFIAKKHLPLCMNTSTIRFKAIDKKIININYFKYFLKTNFFSNQLQKLITGSAQLNFGPSHLKKIDLVLPPIEDQKRIIKILDEADAICQKRKQAIGFLDDYLKSVFLEMFGDPVKNTKEWDRKPLSYFGEVITGNTPPRNDKNNYSSKYIEWIKTDNIVDGEMFITTATEYLSEDGLSKARFIEPGAVLVACIAGSVESIGRVAMTDRKVSFNQQINAIQPNDKVNAIFLYWLLKMSKKYILSHATSGMKKILTKGVFEKIVYIFPPIELQNEFAFIAEKTERIRKQMLSQLGELENQFQSLMQKAFKGEL